MKIALSGSSGLVGAELQKVLRKAGHQVIRLVREVKKVTPDAIFWNPAKGELDPEVLKGVDAVINLSGESVAAGRWTERLKQEILASRLNATKTLVSALNSMTNPPKLLINASAVGVYGDRGDVVCTETTVSGEGFLAEVCRQWEAAAMQAENKGIRTVLLRTGIVLSPQGGALAKMRVPFKLGLGGQLGSGDQYMSWVALDDLVEIILFILTNHSVQGPVNAVAPYPVTNAVFTKTLGKVLHRPTFLPVPACVLRLVLGKEMADEFLLGSTRVIPKKLSDAGFRFKYPDLEPTLKHMIGEQWQNKNHT